MQLREAITLIRHDYFRVNQQSSAWADLGSGAGLFTRALSHYLAGGSVIYSVDREKHAAPLISGKNIRVISLQADFEKDDLPIGKLDGIVMANSLHYVKDKSAFLQKCKQLFCNEVFLIVEYDTDAPVSQWVPYPISFPSLKTLFASVGYSRMDKTGERPSLFGNKNIYATLVQE